MRCRREATQKYRTAFSMQLEWIIVGFALISGSTTCTTASSSSSSSPAPNTIRTHSKNNNINNSSPPAAVADLDNRNIMRLWAALLQAINAAELQRLDMGHAPSAAQTPNAQRLNSKRMKWRPNSKLLDRRSELEPAPFAAAAEQRSGTYTSTEEDNHNPTYIDVRDNEPQPSPWWF